MTSKTMKTATFALMLVAVVSIAATGLFQESMAQTDKGKNYFVSDKDHKKNPDIEKYSELVEELKSSKSNGDKILENSIRNQIQVLNDKITPVEKLPVDVKNHIDSKREKLGEHLVTKLQEAKTKEAKEKVRAEAPIMFISTDEKSGTLRVGIDENYLAHYDQATVIKMVRDIVGEDVDITYESTDTPIPNCSQTGDCEPVQGGVKITVDGIFGGTCSVGFKATYDNYDGFITAGHCGDELDDVGNPSSWSWDKLGYLYEEHWESGTTFDGAFVKSDETTSDKIYYNIAPSSVGTVSDDDLVNMEGYVTKGETGEVIDDSTYLYCSGIYLYDQVQADYDSSNGDSGGPVYTTGASTKLVGIHSCANSSYSWFSPADNLTNEFSGASWDFN